LLLTVLTVAYQMLTCRHFSVDSFAVRAPMSSRSSFNILLGKMSFVCPFPLLPVDQPSIHDARLLVRNAALRLDALTLLRTALMAVLGERVSATAVCYELRQAGICIAPTATPRLNMTAYRRNVQRALNAILVRH
jgi:hypothetical protein